MASNACGSVLLAVSLFVLANAYYPMHQNNQMSCYRPQYNSPSCRESIEDLKALMDLSTSLKEKNSCETCSRHFTEEVIIKLIDALVTTASRNCYKQDEKKNGTCGNREKNETFTNTDTTGGNTEIRTESKGQHNAVYVKDLVTMDTLEEALKKLGVLVNNNDDDDNNNTVEVNIRKTDMIGVNVEGKDKTTS